MQDIYIICFSYSQVEPVLMIGKIIKFSLDCLLQIDATFISPVILLHAWKGFPELTLHLISLGTLMYVES